MFGYHDTNRDSFDLWSPTNHNSYSNTADPIQQGYGVWENTPYHTAIENRAFSPFAKHTQELEDIVEMIGNGVGCTITCDDDMSTSDMRYIENEVFNRYGIVCNLS